MKELLAGLLVSVLMWPFSSFEGAFAGLFVPVLAWPFFSFEGAFSRVVGVSIDVAPLQL